MTSSTTNDRTLRDLYRRLAPVERARLLAQAMRHGDSHQTLLLRDAVPSYDAAAYARSARVLVRLHFPLGAVVTGMLYRAQRDLAYLSVPELRTLADLVLTSPSGEPEAKSGPSGAETARRHSQGTARLSDDEVHVMLMMTAASHLFSRIELAAVTTVVGEMQSCEFGGEDPLTPDIRGILVELGETVETVAGMWNRLSALYHGEPGAEEWPTLEEPDETMVSEMVEQLRDMVEHDGWL